MLFVFVFWCTVCEVFCVLCWCLCLRVFVLFRVVLCRCLCVGVCVLSSSRVFGV